MSEVQSDVNSWEVLATVVSENSFTELVQYEWSKPVNFARIDVYWFSDGGGVQLPKASRLLYWDGNAFVPVKNPVGLGVEGNKYNTTTFEEITTSKLKPEFDSLETASTGILEFKVYDAGKSPKFPPVVKVNRTAALAAAAIAPSPLLRKEFAVTKDVRRARVYVSGIGWSEFYLNGQKVSDRVLDPAATDYDKRVLYVTHDVTGRLKRGPNALGVMLGNGWYCEPGRLRYGDSPRVLLQMQIEYADGSTASVTSDPTWKTIDGPIRRNDFWNGEVYDARLERSGWTLPDYDDSKWTTAAVKPSPGRVVQSQLMPAIKVNQTLRPVKLSVPKPGVYVYDLGQIFGGWVRLRMRGPAGATVSVSEAIAYRVILGGQNPRICSVSIRYGSWRTSSRPPEAALRQAARTAAGGHMRADMVAAGSRAIHQGAAQVDER